MVYRLHQEQLKNVAQALKEPYLVRQTASGVQETPVAGKTPVHREPATPVEEAHPEDRESAGPHSLRPAPAVPSSWLPAMQCVECNDRIPVMDFLYAQKTGLCIRCWEEQESRYDNENTQFLSRAEYPLL